MFDGEVAVCSFWAALEPQRPRRVGTAGEEHFLAFLFCMVESGGAGPHACMEVRASLIMEKLDEVDELGLWRY